MKIIDADAVKAKYPDRRSLCEVMDEAEEVDVYTAEQFREGDMKLLEKMCEHTVCADCPFSSRSCDAFSMDLNELRTWAEAERAKIKELHSGKLCGKNADIMIIDDPIAKGGAE